MLAPMKKTSLTRSIPYWLLLVLSIAAVAVGGWLVWNSTTTMQTTLLDGTATNIEVYVGQAWITAGAAILAAGIIGLLLALGLAAARALIPAFAPVVADEIDGIAETEPSLEPVEGPTTDSDASTGSASESETSTGSATEIEDQNGSSGSTATATKISVK